MNYLILTVIGGVLLFGIVYFIPLKLKPLHKLMYVILSLILANVFLYIYPLIGIWQSAIIVFLLNFLIAYFISKKIPIEKLKLEEQDAKAEEGLKPSSELKEEQQTIATKNEKEVNNEFASIELNREVEKTTIGEEGKEADLPLNEPDLAKSEVIEEPFSLIEEVNDKANKEEMVPEEVEEPFSEVEVLEEIDHLDQNTEELDADEQVNGVDLNEDEALFLHREVGATAEEVLEANDEDLLASEENSLDRESILAQLETNDPIGKENEDEFSQTSETMVQELDELEDIQPETKEENNLDKPQEPMEDIEEIAEDSESLINLNEESPSDELDRQQEELIEKFNTEEENDLEHDEDAITEPTEQVEATLPIIDATPEVRTDSNQLENKEDEMNHEHESDDEPEIDQMENDEDDALIPESVVPIEKVTSKKTNPRMNRQMRDLFIEQLQWSKGNMSVASYETMVQEYTKEELADQDYYIFSTILRDHYIETEQYIKLGKLLEKLKTRFSSNPIILEELAFFEKKFL